MNINFAINEGSLILRKGLISTAKLDSELLMSKIIEKDRKDIILNYSDFLLVLAKLKTQSFHQMLLLPKIHLIYEVLN